MVVNKTKLPEVTNSSYKTRNANAVVNSVLPVFPDLVSNEEDKSQIYHKMCKC